MGERPHYPCLDGLRGVAALMVVFAHVSNANMHLLPGVSLSGIGRMGVWLFFALSAFLLTDQALRALHDQRWKGWLSHYAVARFARIFPLFLFAMAVDLVLGRITASQAFTAALVIEAPGIYWTIPPEFQFYFLIPPLAYLCYSRPAIGTALLAILAASSLWMPATLAVLPYLSVFAIGSLVALTLRTRPDLAQQLARLAPIGLLIVVACVPAFMAIIAPGVDPFGPRNWHHAFGVIWAPVILACAFRARWLEVLATAPARFVGQVSFGLYLLHPLVVAGARPYLEGTHWGGAVAALAALGVAWLAYVAIEAPARSWLTARVSGGNRAKGQSRSPAYHR